MSSDRSQTVPQADSASTAAVDLDWLTLDDGEEVLWASTPHKSSLAGALVIGVPLSVFLIGIPMVVGSYLNYTNTNYVVTTRGLYRKRGIFSRDVKQIGFDKVQNISYSQGALGSSLGYGTVEISTAGSSGAELQFRNIPTPAEIQELISREIERREDTTREQDADVDDVLSEILTELRGIRQALDGESVDTKTDGASANTETEAPSAIGSDTGGQADAAESDDGTPDDPFEPAAPEPADDQ